jgi:hypothetical protein
MVLTRGNSIEYWWNVTDRGKPKHLDKSHYQCLCIHHKSTWADLASNTVLLGERPATDHLRHGARRTSQFQ